MQNKVMDFILKAVVISVIITVIVYGFFDGMQRQEIVDCNTWQKQAKEFPLFYITNWQDEQCRTHGIIVSAPIK